MNENLTELDQTLLKAYCDILENDKDFEFIKKSNQSELSVIFLPAVSKNYCAAKNKIMIIGRETATDNKQAIKWVDGMPTNKYIKTWMLERRKYGIEKWLIDSNDRGFTFFNFLRQVSECSGLDGVVWANLFCYDWNKGLINKSPLVAEIKRISTKLLEAQINILKPDYIIFAHGVSGYSVNQRLKLFPREKCETKIISEYNNNKYLWSFDYKWNEDYNVQCYRIHHPSAFNKEAQAARKFLINKLLPKS
ncbi:MAG: hypothetical protein QM533_07890 [Cytophagales bacterium]|nr:hypothetical protein [Cytophagales bacterium]